MKYYLLTQSLYLYDAVGNDLFHQYDLLKKLNHNVYIYAENYDSRLNLNDFNTASLEDIKTANIKESVVIYHHSAFWEVGYDILQNIKCQLYIKYHNITPGSFFEKYSELYEKICKEGEIQTKKIINNLNVYKYLCASKFNGEELIKLGAKREKIEVSPPFHKVDDFGKTDLDLELVDRLVVDKVNILFVGRVVPNKGIHHLIETLNTYTQLYGENVHLHIVGKRIEELSSFNIEIDQLIHDKYLENFITFYEQESFEKLNTLYAISHVFLLLSEHEGFCVPILEAQKNLLPIIAVQSSAIGETIGNSQAVLEEYNYKKIAAAINVVVSDNMKREYLIENGMKNMERFGIAKLENEFLEALGLEN